MHNKMHLVVLVLFSAAICHCKNVVTDVGGNYTTDGTVSTSTIASSTSTPQNVSCDTFSGHGQCEDCVKHKVCYYCESDEKCKLYVAKEIIPTEECSVKNIRYLTCSISFKTLIILAGTLAGIVLLVIICVCCYCCCKRKGIKISKDEIKFARQREERKVRAEERKKERASRTDEIRRKYGLMKDDNPYERFDEK